MKIGVLSDTHIPFRAKKLPEYLLSSLEGVDLIIHAGDIVFLDVLEELRKIAPVEAVYGNTDPKAVQMKLPGKLNLELAGYKVAVTHGHIFQGQLLAKLSYTFPEADLIIFGHTHKPFLQSIGGQVFFNPGSPTDKRLQPKPSFGMIELAEDIQAEIIEF